MLDLITKADDENKVKYIWFDTGLEYKATKDQLDYLESRYNVNINRVKAVKPIPMCVKEYGVPFMSKYVSEMIYRLQKHNFKFEDRTLEELIKEYPKCIGAVKWWCNALGTKVKQYNISYNMYLKEFLIQNPPQFRISNRCCMYAKKKTAEKFQKENAADIAIVGLRKYEGGARSVIFKTCYSDSRPGHPAYFRPIFWMTESDKSDYEDSFDIKHSDCYTKYGLKRTGCVGCPYGKHCVEELDVIKNNEPNLYKACVNIFGESYEYTKKYKEFCNDMRKKEKETQQQNQSGHIDN